jgi:hypothetical protein
METLKLNVLGLIPFSIYDGDYYRLISKLQIYAYLKCLLAKTLKQINPGWITRYQRWIYR